MKKLFTLAAALLASFSLWAAVTVPSGTLDPAEVPTTGWAGKYSPAYVENGDWVCFSSYEIYQSTQSWADKGTSGSTDGTWAAIDPFPAQSAWTTNDGKVATLNGTSKGPYYYRITKTTDVAILGKSGSNKKRTIFLEAYLLTDGEVGDTPVKSNSFEVNDDAIASISELDGSKEYVIVVRQEGSGSGGSSSGNSPYYAIAFKKAAAAPVTDPVASVTIEGPTEAAVGFAAKYTATTDVAATEYKWFVDDVEQTGETKKTFEFTPAAKGAIYAIVCKARNDNNATDEWIASTSINVTGTKLCGELFKATTQGTVTGVIGGTYDTNNGTGDTKKLDKSKYYGVKLANGSFMAGDVFTINVTTAANTEGSKFMLYADKEGTDLIVDAGSEGYLNVTGELTVTLPAAANGKNSIYLYRENGNTQWNPTFNWFSVTRSCEDSNDATIHSLTVNGNEVAENNGLFEYTLSASYEEPTVTIAFEIHPLATIKYGLSNPYELTTPDVGDSRGQAFTIIAEDGTEKTYTVQIYKSAELSNDWHLKELSVEGYTLTPEFDTETLTYHITRAYEAANPAVSAITAVARHEGATVEIQDYSGTATPNFTINVTAENGSENAYVIWIDVAPAVKKINEVILSNGYSAYIVEGQSVEPFIINGFYLAGQEAPTVKSYQVNDGTTWAIDGNNITLTGADNSIALYSLVLAEVAPVEFSADEITFDGTEAWVKAANGFGADKGGWKFSKTDSDFSREIAGKTHVEFFLPACDTVVLKAGASGTERDVRFYVNGTQLGDKAKLTKAGVALAVEQSAPFMLTVASAQTSGDGGVGALRMAKKPVDPTAIDNTNDEVKAVKIIRDGQLFIQKKGVLYNAQGAVVK